MASSPHRLRMKDERTCIYMADSPFLRNYRFFTAIVDRTTKPKRVFIVEIPTRPTSVPTAGRILPPSRPLPSILVAEAMKCPAPANVGVASPIPHIGNLKFQRTLSDEKTLVLANVGPIHFGQRLMR